MAGCAVHFRFARADRVDDNAHSTCGHTAAGEAWTYTTPVAASANWFAARIYCSFGSTRDVFPNDLVGAELLADGCVSCVSIVPCEASVALVCPEFSQDFVRQRWPARVRPLPEFAVSQRQERQIRLRIDPQKRP